MDGGDVVGVHGVADGPVAGAGLEQLLEHRHTSPRLPHSLQPFVSLTSIGW